ncbi:transcriptional regulator of sugar metabolism [Vibrio ichthyoenteri ATCC 700023]|uniref:Transcriptional regulator of sugar metabolism n=2 Tax=Vibrio ichthyoenteri TaxID=142461 RepID=F9S6P5_9VIBR|nr:transcriptional regulator of sugar metabolism [Vibrio ichthyoenteri ATCC 700023]
MKTAIERRLEITNMVGMRGRMHVDELAEYFNVTGATIRADLRFLEDQGSIIRSHGFALVNRSVLAKLAMSATSKSQNSSLGFYDYVAHSFHRALEEKSTIFVDSSPVIRKSLKQLKDLKSSTVVTRDLNLIQNIPHITDCKFFVTGGRVNTEQMKMSGSHMINSLKQYRFNNVLLHVESFNTKLGVFSKSEFDADMIRLLCDLSEKITLIVESSAFNSNDSFWACDPNKIDTVITDHNLDDKNSESLKLNGVRVLTLKSNN